MGLTKDQLEAEAMKLSSEDRAHLVERLLGSLEPDSQWEQVWALEARRRLDEMYGSQTTSIPHEEAMRQARSALRRRP